MNELLAFENISCEANALPNNLLVYKKFAFFLVRGLKARFSGLRS